MKQARSTPQTETADWELFLRIKHPSLDPAEISAALDIQAEESIAAGPQVSSSGVRRLHNETYWIASLATFGVVEASLHDMSIVTRLKRLESSGAFFERINRDGGSVTLIVDRGDREEPVVLNRCLAKLAALGIALEID